MDPCKGCLGSPGGRWAGRVFERRCALAPVARDARTLSSCQFFQKGPSRGCSFGSKGMAFGVPGGIPERPNGSDCKSDGYAFAGSNPAPATTSPAANSPAAGHSVLWPLVPRGGYRRPSRASSGCRNVPAVETFRLSKSSGCLRGQLVSIQLMWPRHLASRVCVPVFETFTLSGPAGNTSAGSAMGDPPGGCSSMVERQPSKLHTGVRFPPPAPPPMAPGLIAQGQSARWPTLPRSAHSRSSHTTW